MVSKVRFEGHVNNQIIYRNYKHHKILAHTHTTIIFIKHFSSCYGTKTNKPELVTAADGPMYLLVHLDRRSRHSVRVRKAGETWSTRVQCACLSILPDGLDVQPGFKCRPGRLKRLCSTCMPRCEEWGHRHAISAAWSGDFDLIWLIDCFKSSKP